MFSNRIIVEWGTLIWIQNSLKTESELSIT